MLLANLSPKLVLSIERDADLELEGERKFALILMNTSQLQNNLSTIREMRYRLQSFILNKERVHRQSMKQYLARRTLDVYYT